MLLHQAMKIIIQCASSKVATAPSFVTQAGRAVMFVAHPSKAPRHEEWLYARPDDPSDASGQSWRQRLFAYNCGDENPLGLLKAYRLYEPPIYADLVTWLGVANVLILSAGWGLVRADYLLPSYDITFSAAAESYKRRRLQDRFDDFCHFQTDESGPVVFFGGKAYFPLLRQLAAPLMCEKVLFYASNCPPTELEGWRVVHYRRSYTNWHYACAKEFLQGKISIN
jgi:hypothetical protein